MDWIQRFVILIWSTRAWSGSCWEVATEVLEYKNFIKTLRLTEVGLAAFSTVANMHQRVKLGQCFKMEVVKRKRNTDMSRKINIV